MTKPMPAFSDRPTRLLFASYPKPLGEKLLALRNRIFHVAWVACSIVFAVCASTAVAQEGVVISGTVVSASDGRPLERVVAVIDGLTRASTDAAGRYSTSPLTPVDGRIRVVWQRIGFLPFDSVLAVGPETSSVLVDIALEPLPFTLDEITVQGSRVRITNPGMVGFYNRREEGLGRYVTEEEVQRALSFDLGSYFVRLQRANPGPVCFPWEENIAYLDGIPFFDVGVLNRIVAPAQVAGIEFYTKQDVHKLPEEFIPSRPFCTVTMLWTREVEGATTDVYRGYALGASFGPSLAGPSTDFFVRGHVLVPISIASPRLDLRLSLATATRQDIQWRGSAAVAMRLSGSTKPFLISGGVAFTKTQSSGPVDRDPLVGIGYTTNLGRLQPWIELQFVGTQALSLAGFNFRFGSIEDASDSESYGRF